MKKRKRVLILNVWRTLETVKDNPLAICDWRSLKKEDALEFRVRPTHIGNSVQAWSYGPHQRWFYLPNQEPHEVYVFMQHDSHGEGKHGINVPHTSIILDGQENDTPTRISYEFRIAALMDD
ncbi:uncharacterized protein MELLADRAFT_33473 [Melampsora larici-populina 98AG31]|uniref:Uncharacterized protein n=1 Tax=Melampsora larici-populina (strain 98AG31 / pathotype 3-4-7) TaxID=747676 RepID=F4R9G3_MELLP|nr:uncharacterized protein MELLADRAFT_33473 [Melampsora larici-populina 98AG31]EGG11157.1 hypothetical protein MELLADRAFT_33473 [Melampsora larici-populina 98AG31]